MVLKSRDPPSMEVAAEVGAGDVLVCRTRTRALTGRRHGGDGMEPSGDLAGRPRIGDRKFIAERREYGVRRGTLGAAKLGCGY